MILGFLKEIPEALRGRGVKVTRSLGERSSKSLKAFSFSSLPRVR